MSARTEGPRLATVLIAVPIAGLLAAICGAVFIAIAFGGTAAGCGGEATGTVKGVPSKLVPIYRQASSRYALGTKGPAILAAINFIETSFGTNLNNSSAGAQGWMQFMPETWAAYGVDGDGDGDKDTNDPWDAIYAAANYLHASGAPKDWPKAIFAYNHADWYVEDVLAAAQKFGAGVAVAVTPGATCIVSAGDADLLKAQALYSPRVFEPIPAKLWIGDGAPQSVDARIWPDAVWLLETYDLLVTAAREAGHATHGDGTALDIVPASGRGWDGTALRAARALGWIPSCGWNGSAPICPLVPAIQWVGYNGYDGHGDPAHTSTPHLHVSWKASEYGCLGLCAPRTWVMAFPLVH
ncbi:MAG: lytic transglycosylase domain-containing protein [Solirubrobacterales bacterium]